MGKSGKKIKSDRINALRKQYDAFIDEDKRRRDRNDFILGRLEKIRLCNTMVPLRHMEDPQISKYYCANQDRLDCNKKITRFDESLSLRPRSTDVLPECVMKDEQKILNEISKKYILIPKLRTSNESRFATYYNPPSSSNDDDWKSKYDILDDLKKIEKEPSEFSNANLDKKSDNISNNKDQSLYGITQKDVISDPFYKSQPINERPSISTLQPNKEESEVTLKNVPCSNVEYNQCDEIPKTVGNYNSNVTTCSINQDKYIPDSNKNKEFYPNEHVPLVDQASEENNNKTVNMVQDIQLNDIKDPDDSKTRGEDEVDENLISESVVEPNTVNPSIDRTVDNNFSLGLEGGKNMDKILKPDAIGLQPTEIENQKPYENVVQCEASSENSPQLQYEPNNESTVSENIISSQIDEFETEQKEMFYSEETEYNQNVDNTEYTASNEDYTNEQYSYYNQSQQEQPYYAEVNEHEESTERYDPNYEQQYVNNYENVNVALYGNQQYGENYENQPDTMNENYEQQPVNLEYVPSEISGNMDDIHTENLSTYNSQAGENISHETQESDNNEINEIEEFVIPPVQNVNENLQDYLQTSTEVDTLQNIEKQLDKEQGYIDIKDVIESEPPTEAENISQVQNIPAVQKPDISVT